MSEYETGDHIIRQVGQDNPTAENLEESGRSEGPARGENSEKSDGLEQHKNSLAGLLGRVSTMLKGAKTCLVDMKHSELETALKSLNSAWKKYDNSYSFYVMKEIPEQEFNRVKNKHDETQTEYHACTNAIYECLKRLKSQEKPKGKSNKSYPSSKQSKLTEIRKSIEMKKLMLQQEQELAQYKLEMENKKVELEFERKRRACEMKFQIQMAEKEAELLEDGSDTVSKYSLEDKGEFSLMPPMTQQEKIVRWSAGCDEKPLNPEVPNFVPSKGPLKDSSQNVMKTNQPTKKESTCERECEVLSPKPQSVNPITSNDTTAVLLKLTMLQAMQPIKFSGSPSDYPIFRDRLRDNLEDGILTDSQKLEFLPKYLAGEAYEVVERVSGCSYEAVLDILHARYGQPATVAAGCIENLTKGQKLSNNDYIGLQNFAEQLESASKKLSGEYELEASTMTNLKQIVKRLPNYLVNKWGDASFKIRESGSTPRLSDLAKFVKRQAAIKNDPGFVNDKRPERQTESNIRPNKQTSAFSTDVKTLRENDNPLNTERNTEKRSSNHCPCCSGNHELTECEKFKADDIQARWEIVKQHKLCHACLKSGHMRARCKFKGFCKCGSDRRHHRLLHHPYKKNRSDVEQGPQPEKQPQRQPQAEGREVQQGDSLRTVEQYATATENLSKTVLLHVLPVKVIAPNGCVLTTYGLLDNASRGTIISSDVANTLGLKGRRKLVSVNTLMDKTNEEFQEVNFQLQSASSVGEIITVHEGLVSEKFNISERWLPRDIDTSLYPHLKGIRIPDVEIKKVSILIGKDVDHAHEVFEVRKPGTPHSQLRALRGPLGWVITGTLQGVPAPKELNINFTSCDKKLHDQIENFWNLDAFGTRNDYVSRNGTDAKEHSTLASHNLSREDMHAVDILQRTTKMRSGHYETGLLWRNEEVQLPNNRSEAERRMQSLKRKFSSQPDLEERYRAVMEDYIAKGHARKLSPEEAANRGPRTWYLPHFAVVNPNKPGKVRIVFDAAAECEGTSLNKNLLHGPDYTNSLVGVLLRFREDNTALVADIESMFHQVKVREEDQDSLRFLWWTESTTDSPEEYVMTVHIFGATDSPCAANATLKRTADDNAKDFDPVTIETVKRNFYVDDLLKSVHTPSAAIPLADQLVKLCAKGGFNLTKFESNDRQVLAEIPVKKRATPSLDLDLDQLPINRALGVRWNIESDTLGFKTADLQKPDTMRGVLSTIASVFDPLNFAAPVMLPAKQIMQTLWRRKMPWDHPISGEILEKWKMWKSRLPLLENLSIPRCYFSRLEHEGVKLQLHHFCDASEVGYGTASYLRIEYSDGETECPFLIGKSRNAPIKSVSLPRLELQGALLAARIDSAVRSELDFQFDKVVFWSDSMITLNYIKNENRRFQTFVANRVSEIRELTHPDQWKHCPGKINPADDVSRGLEMDDFLKNDRWLKGPSFLREPEEKWPENNYDVLPPESLEVKKEIFATSLEPTTTVEDLITESSNWVHTLRKVAWILKFLDWIKWRVAQKRDPEVINVNGDINCEDLERAKRRIVAVIQKISFPDEVTSLNKGKQVKASSRIIKLKPILKGDGIIRVGGRISKAPISADAINPMILPKNHHISTILIRNLHETNGHCGVEQVLSLLREQFWIVKARSAIKKILRTCVHCRKQMGPKVNQQMGDLPKVRLTPYEPPFSYSGVDYFGPFYVKRGRGRVMEKRWGVIFVCMNSRAVHLELAKSLETDDFMLVLMRFLNRRGHVKEIRSDNGTNFVGADKEIKDALKSMENSKVQRDLMKRGCNWVFHPPGASHMSGVWERLVRTVKRSLKAILGNSPMNEEVLTTVLTEAESVANSRPLTPNSSSPDDAEPLTPNHFLNVRGSMNIPPDVVDEKDKFSRKRWRQAQLLANHFWNRWIKEYIPSLQQRHKWQQEQRNVRVGDIVLIADDNVKRNQWRLGRVINSFPGSDGLVRSVEVRTEGGTLKRPVTKLCLLEGVNDE